jgi:hypothetical protein
MDRTPAGEEKEGLEGSLKPSSGQEVTGQGRETGELQSDFEREAPKTENSITQFTGRVKHQPRLTALFGSRRIFLHAGVKLNCLWLAIHVSDILREVKDNILGGSSKRRSDRV